MDYAMISADDHLDLQYLPADLWTVRLPASLRDRLPHVEHRDAGAVWVCDGGIWGRWAGAPRPRGPKATFNASDYPHPDSTWPNSRTVMDKQMGDLSPAVRRQLTRDNAAGLYGL